MMRCTRCVVDPNPHGPSACADCRRMDFLSQPVPRPMAPSEYGEVVVTWERPPREDYLHITREVHGYKVEPGVEYRDGDDIEYIGQELWHIVKDWTGADQMLAARAVGQGIAHRWPDRAYFVEVWKDGSIVMAQVFQPFGVPRNR